MPIHTLLAGLDPATAALLLAASFTGSFVTVAMGIGGGALLLAIMAASLPPAAVIPVHGVIQVGSNALRAVLMLKHTHWPPFAAFALGTVAGALIGGNIAMSLPPHIALIGLGAFIIWSVLGRPPAWLSRWPALNGGISSFLTMFFGATGPFVATYIKSLKLERQPHVATHAVFMALQHALKITIFAALGFAYGPWLPFIALMIAAGFAGTLTGRAVLIRMNDALFKRALNTILLLIAARLIWQGLTTA